METIVFPFESKQHVTTWLSQQSKSPTVSFVKVCIENRIKDGTSGVFFCKWLPTQEELVAVDQKWSPSKRQRPNLENHCAVMSTATSSFQGRCLASDSIFGYEYSLSSAVQ